MTKRKTVGLYPLNGRISLCMYHQGLPNIILLGIIFIQPIKYPNTNTRAFPFHEYVVAQLGFLSDSYAAIFFQVLHVSKVDLLCGLNTQQLHVHIHIPHTHTTSLSYTKHEYQLIQAPSCPLPIFPGLCQMPSITIDVVMVMPCKFTSVHIKLSTSQP